MTIIFRQWSYGLDGIQTTIALMLWLGFEHRTCWDIWPMLKKIHYFFTSLWQPAKYQHCPTWCCGEKAISWITRLNFNPEKSVLPRSVTELINRISYWPILPKDVGIVSEPNIKVVSCHILHDPAYSRFSSEQSLQFYRYYRSSVMTHWAQRTHKLSKFYSCSSLQFQKFLKIHKEYQWKCGYWLRNAPSVRATYSPCYWLYNARWWGLWNKSNLTIEKIWVA